MRKEILLVLFVLLFAAFGCSWMNGPSKSDPAVNANSVPTAAANSAAAAPSGGSTFTPGTEATGDIFKSFDTFMNVPRFRAVMKGSGKTPVETTVEFVAPDSYHIRSGSDGQEMISVGKKMYLKAGGDWKEMPASFASLIPDMRKTFDAEGRKWVSDVKLEGEDNIDGKAVYKYSFRGKGVGGIGENESTAYVSKDTGLPIRIEARYVKGDLKEMDINYEYPADIQIEAPKK